MRQSYSQLRAKNAQSRALLRSIRGGSRPEVRLLRSIRGWLLFFMLALVISGATAIPIALELQLVLRFVPAGTSLHDWLERVLVAYSDVQAKHLFLLYGYDWLAFAHFVLAVLFIGPYRDPVRNIWVIEFGMIACLLIFPLAFIMGPLRGIPIGWILIDCSFGLVGILPLALVRRKIKALEQGLHENPVTTISRSLEAPNPAH